jgi:hypothetical protein
MKTLFTRWPMLLALTLVGLLVGLAAPASASIAMIGFAGTALASGNPTLLDLAKRLDPGGSVADVVEILNETNEVLDDMTWLEGNLPTGHRSVIRTGIPTPTWRKMYGAVAPGKSTTAAVTDTCGMLEAYSNVDKALADINGNTAAFRMSEDKAFLEGMSEEVAGTLFYGNQGTEPEAFTGLAPRFSGLTAAQSGDNIIDAFTGSGGDLTSIWLVVWGPRTVHGIVPQGSKAGFQQQDLGETMIQSSSGNYQAYVTHYRWDAGLCVRDWRYVARVANIDVSEILVASDAKRLITFMIQAVERIPNLGAGRPVFYMNRRVREALRIGIIEKIANNLTWDTVAGKHVMTFDSIPVRRSDQILITESRVV